MLPSLTFSPVGFPMPSVLASRFFFSVVVPFAGSFSVLTLPFATLVEAGTFSVETFVGMTGDTAFPVTGTVDAVVVAAVLLVDVSGFLFPATSFFHLRTVSFAKSATFLSS